MSPQRGQAVPLAQAGDTSTILVILPGFPVVANDVTVNWLRINGEFKLSGATVHLQAKTAGSGSGSGGNIVLDVLRSANFGASFVSLFLSGLANKLILPPGTSHADVPISLAIDTLNDGDLLRVDILQVDSGGTSSDISFDIVRA